MSAPERLWLVSLPTGEHHFIVKEPLEGITEWCKGTNSMISVEEAFARTEDRRNRWVRLGVELTTGIWTYMCPKCGAWFRLVTLPKMPSVCPKCHVTLGEAPSPNGNH